MLLFAIPTFAAPADAPLKNASFTEGLDAKGIPVGWRRYGGTGKGQRLSLADAPGRAGKALLIEDGDGEQEMVVGLSAGLVVCLDAECRKVWTRALPSPPLVLHHVNVGKPWLLAGCEDGTVVVAEGRRAP